MYRMVIVDDEPAELNFIAWVVKNNNLPIHICGIGCNGEDALALADTYQPDFMILDISMPILSGLDAARIIKEKHPKIQIYILTAFQRFAYAQAAVKINVEDYLCKPISPEALVEVLLTGIKRCLRERLEYCRRNRVLHQAREEYHSMPKLLEFLGLSKIHYNQQDLGQVEWFLTGYLQCPQQPDSERALLPALIKHLRQAVVLKQAVPIAGGKMVAWGKGKGAQVARQLQDSGEKWSAAAGAQFGAVLVALDKSKPNILAELRRAVGQADIAQFWEHTGICLLAADTVPLRPSPDLDAFCSQFVNGIFLAGSEPPDTLLYQLLAELEARHSTREETVQVILDFFAVVADKFNELGITVDLAGFRQRLQQAVAACYTIGQLKALVRTMGQELIDQSYCERKNNSLAAVEEAKKIIENNYRSNITLEGMAGQLYLSPAYFSRIFKKHTGQGFSQYLNSTRMEKAKSFLLTGKYSVAEVADKIGIQDPSYFHHVFKKYHHVTPGYFSGNRKKV